MEKDNQVSHYLKYGLRPRYEHIKVNILYGDDGFPDTLQAETFKSADLATVAQEVLDLFTIIRKDLGYIDSIEFIHHGEHIIVKKTYTVEDIVEIYNMQKAIQEKANKKKDEQVEKYLANKTTNAGV